jgi:hypothetical protein
MFNTPRTTQIPYSAHSFGTTNDKTGKFSSNFLEEMRNCPHVGKAVVKAYREARTAFSDDGAPAAKGGGFLPKRTQQPAPFYL